MPRFDKGQDGRDVLSVEDQYDIIIAQLEVRPLAISEIKVGDLSRKTVESRVRELLDFDEIRVLKWKPGSGGYTRIFTVGGGESAPKPTGGCRVHKRSEHYALPPEVKASLASLDAITRAMVKVRGGHA